jgi:hypothetical protein
MFPPGFLGTRADVLIDIVMLSFAIILPLLMFSWHQARNRKNYQLHRNTQVILGVSLAIVVAIFEYDLSVSGGIFALTKGSIYEGTAILNGTIYVHTAFSVLTSFIWVGLIIASLVKFPSPPQPGPFSKSHRFWGRTGMVTMIMSGITAPPLYYFGFVA